MDLRFLAEVVAGIRLFRILNIWMVVVGTLDTWRFGNLEFEIISLILHVIFTFTKSIFNGLLIKVELTSTIELLQTST